MIVGAVDPGMSGALAVVSNHGDCETIFMPVIDDVVDAMSVITFFREHKVDFVVLEKVHSMPRQGVVSTFTFGHATGQARAAAQVVCMPIQPRLVRPQEWKKAFGLLKANKNASREMAIEVFPRAADQFKRVKDHGRAEAALIGAYHLGMHQTFPVRNQ